MRILASYPSRLLTASVSLALALLAYNATAQYFDVNGATTGYGVVNGGSYSWDDPNWGVSGGAGATANWTAGGFARFYGGVSGDAYTVTVNNVESIAGMWQHAPGVTVTINAAGAGALSIASGLQGFLGASSGVTIINAPIGGSGGIAPETTGSSIYLYGNNSYSGGTTLGFSGAPLVYFNNNNSFGSSTMTFSVASGVFQALLGKGGSTITLANPWTVTTSGGGLNFAADASTPVISSGNWSLGANTLNLRSSGGSTSPLTLSGQISGTGNLSLSANNNSAIILSGANPFSGTVTVGVGATPVTLKLGAANTIASSSSLIMAGGILNPGGFNHAMGSTTLGVTANSTIDFAAGASELDFANSSALTWTGTLNLLNWDFGTDALRFGTDSTALTSAQLAMIEFNGAGLGTAQLDALGFVVVPEPTSAVLGLLGLGVIGALRRRKA